MCGVRSFETNIDRSPPTMMPVGKMETHASPSVYGCLVRVLTKPAGGCHSSLSYSLPVASRTCRRSTRCTLRSTVIRVARLELPDRNVDGSVLSKLCG